MNRSHLKIVCLLLSALLTSTTGAGGRIGRISGDLPAAVERPLTLGECVQRALRHGFDLEIENFNVEAARESIVDARSQFDPLLSASISRNVLRFAGDTLLPRTRSESTSTSAGVSQRLTLGTDLALGTNLGRSEIDPASAALNPAYASDLTLALRQPLLKGLGTTVNKAPIRRAEIGLDNAERSYESRALDVIQATEIAYYVLSGSREQLGVFEASLSLAEKLLEEAKARNAAGMSTKLDVLQAEVGVANARRGILEARNAVQDSEDTLLSLMGRFELDEALGPTSVDEVNRIDLPQIESSFAMALQHQPEYAGARAAIDLARLDTTLARNDLKPSLDLDVALGVNGSDRTSRGAFSHTFAGDDNAWQAGLLVTYPIGRRGEKARYRQSQSRLTRQELQLKQLEQDILLDVRSAVRDIETNFQSVQIAAQAADLARQQYEAEIARFKSGLSTSRRVLEAQTDLQSARVAHAQSKLDLSTARSRLRRIESNGLEHYGGGVK